MEHQITKIWDEFSGQLRQFILSRVSNESLADDILQDVFVKIYSRIDTLKDTTKIKSWLYQITRNTIIDHYRGQKEMMELPETLAEIGEYEDMTDDSPHRRLVSGIKGLVQELPEKYRQAIVLTEFQGMSQKELAEHLGISVSGAKSRVQRGRQKLKQMLLDCCHFECDRYGTILACHQRIDSDDK